MIKISNKGSTALEYAFLVMCLVAGMLMMSQYARRAISGGVKNASDQVSPKHYDPSVGTNLTVENHSKRTSVSETVPDEQIDPVTGKTVQGWQTTITDNIEFDTTTRHGTE